MLINYLEMLIKTGSTPWVAVELVRLSPHELQVKIGEDYYVIPSDYDITQYIVNPTEKGPEGLFLAMVAYGKPPKLYCLPTGPHDQRELTDEILKPRSGFMSSEEFQERLLNSPKIKEKYLQLQDKQRRFKDAYQTFEQLQQNSLEFAKSLKESPLVPSMPDNQEIPVYKDHTSTSQNEMFLYANGPDTTKKNKPSRKAQASIKKLYS
jgi:hypothetical protein